MFEAVEVVSYAFMLIYDVKSGYASIWNLLDFSMLYGCVFTMKVYFKY